MHFYDDFYDSFKYIVFNRLFIYIIYFARSLTKFLIFSRFIYVTSTCDAFFVFVNIDL
jgi:hypothetical protein